MKRIIQQTHDSASFFVTEGDQTIIGQSVNVAGAIDRVQRMRAANIDNATLGKCVASIPIAAIAQWAQQFGIDVHEVMNDDALLDRCIADYSKFKVHGGYVT